MSELVTIGGVGPWERIRNIPHRDLHGDITRVTLEQGGDWIEFSGDRGSLVHSAQFADGQIWDAWNGWRCEPRPHSWKVAADAAETFHVK